MSLVVELNDLPGPSEMTFQRTARHGPAVILFLMAQAGGMGTPAIEHLGNVADRLAHLDEPKIQIHVLRDAHLLVESADCANQLGPGGDQMNEVRMAEVMVVRECRPGIDTANGVEDFARDCLVTVDHVRLIVKDGLGEPVQRMRLQKVIVVHECDVITSRLGDASIRGRADAAVGFTVDHAAPWNRVLTVRRAPGGYAGQSSDR